MRVQKTQVSIGARPVAESAALANMPTTYVHVLDEVNHTERRYSYPWPLADALKNHGETVLALDLANYWGYADADDDDPLSLAVSIRHDSERCITIRWFAVGDIDQAREELADILAGRIPGSGPSWGCGGARA